jgi:hypothetical protein
MLRCFALLGTLAVALAAGCSTGAVGVDACKQIEEARCRKAPSCNISLQGLNNPSGSDVDACIRYYDIDCLHGLAIGTEPSTTQVSQCLAAITSDNLMADGCSVVAEPQTSSHCAWLVPPSDQDAEAGAATDASDAAAATDGDDGG